MRRLSWYTSFSRSFKRRTKNNKDLQERVYKTLEALSQNPFDPKLKTHKLHGQLEGYWACSIDYDLRVIFTFEPDPTSKEDLIVLVELGTHEEVY